eukprot:Nitzschia sp. Nitz4//scaffold209_size42451//29505//31061//NITZ4_007361-RA/size42451-processed-gene-0.36-mRNA-1//-1//CDS//3329541709//4721//frame0
MLSPSNLRQRHGKKGDGTPLNQSVTKLPLVDSQGNSYNEFTDIPTADSTSERPPIVPRSSSRSGSISGEEEGNRAMTAKQVAKDESRFKKMMTRVTSALAMISVFFACLYGGHLYVCMIVALAEIMLFRELVKVRYNVYYTTVQGTIPLFRTLQWMWFYVAIFYTYGDFLSEVVQSNFRLHYLAPYANYLFTYGAFAFYSGTFVLTIATMQTGHIKFQVNQWCWTIVVLCLTVGQMKYIMHNIFNGLFWFAFPLLLVIVNDIMAYLSGITCGRKFIQRPFIKFSPNKTWEGFIGGGVFTMIAAWYLSRTMAQSKWMTCPTNEFRWTHYDIECDVHHVFQQAQSVVPTQVFEVFPIQLVRMIPGIVEYCNNSAKEGGIVERCISGEPGQTFHHFELVLKDVYPVQIHAIWLGLFASVVAPFGGFLASAIKRAYGVKDFDSLIPGHGGVTDRLDCQFLMALYTWVHYNTFVKLATVSVPKLLYMFHMLSPLEQEQFVDAIRRTAGKTVKDRLKEYEDFSY